MPLSWSLCPHPGTQDFVIAADKDVRYEQVVNVMKALQEAKIERVGLALRIEASQR